MYAALWRVLPGPWWVRVLILIVLAAIILYLLFYYAFPWVFHTLWPSEESTVGGGG